MIVVGIDPGFARMGVAVLSSQPGWSHSCPSIERLELWETEPDKASKSKAADHTRRLLTYADKLVSLMPDPTAVDAVAVEVQQLPVGRIQISTVMNLGRVRGMFDVLAAQGVPVMDLQPNAVKKWVTGDHHASKEQVEAALMRRYPELAEKLQAWPQSKREHLTDALALATVAWMKINNAMKED